MHRRTDANLVPAVQKKTAGRWPAAFYRCASYLLVEPEVPPVVPLLPPVVPVLPEVPLLPEPIPLVDGVVVAPLLLGEDVLLSLEPPSVPDAPPELLLLALKCLSHSEREICPSLFSSTDENCGWLPDMPLEAPPVDEPPAEELSPDELPVAEEPPPEALPVLPLDMPDEPLELEPLVALGVELDLSLELAPDDELSAAISAPETRKSAAAVVVPRNLNISDSSFKGGGRAAGSYMQPLCLGRPKARILRRGGRRRCAGARALCRNFRSPRLPGRGRL